MAVKKPDAVPASCAVVCVYIGPSKKNAIQTMTVYPGAKEDVLNLPEVKLATAKYPDVATLIVSAESLSASKTEARTKGTALNKAYKSIMNSD